MAVIKIGNYTYAQGETTQHLDPYTGVTTKTSYEGDPAAITSLATQLFNEGWTCDIVTRTASTGVNRSTLNVEKADNFVLPPVVWEIGNTKGEKNILDCKELPFVAGCSPQTKANIEFRLKNPSSKQPLSANSGSNPSEPANAELLLALMQTGIESKMVPNIEVKRTIVVPNTYPFPWDLNYVGSVISTGTLINTFNVPSYFQNILPAGDTAVQTDSNGFTTFTGYYVDQPSYQTTLRNRVTVSQTFLFNKWSVLPKGEYSFSG